MKFLLALLAIFIANITYAKDLPINLLKLPSGFNISIYTASVPNARQMVLGTKGTLFVGTLNEGKVYAVIPDKNKPNSMQVITIASGLDMPTGVAFYNDALYVAEKSRILRFDHIEDNLSHPPKPIVITTNLPDKKYHGWRFIGFGPDKKLYVAIGVPCNACLEEDERFGTIMRMDTDGSNSEIFVKGIRNSVGFDWDPTTQHLWFTDNGRDWVGDDLPPEKLNYAPQKGMHFGFPYFDGNDLPNVTFGKHTMSDFTPATYELPAHVAPLGMSFYTGKMFPQEYSNQIFIAEHGSWNRTTKVGYQVIVVKILKDKVIEAKPFITGWLHDGKVWGRPVDTLVMPDGALLISDDHAGAIYRVSYSR